MAKRKRLYTQTMKLPPILTKLEALTSPNRLETYTAQPFKLNQFAPSFTKDFSHSLYAVTAAG
jgi:hypothetical protein